MASATEISMRQRQTRAMIDAEPIILTLSRHGWVSDDAGGWRPGPSASLAPQTLRLIAGNNQLPVRQTVDGTEAQPVYTLLGMPTADVKNGDTFELDGIRYEVVFVQPNKLEALRAEVAYGR